MTVRHLILPMLLVLLLSTMVHAKGGKSKKGGGTGTSKYATDEIYCTETGINCTATCCLGTTCGANMTECEYQTMENGITAVYGLVSVGTVLFLIPCLINFCLYLCRHRFCLKKDPEVNKVYGGMSICECFFKYFCCSCFCCCRRQSKRENFDGTIIDEQDTILDSNKRPYFGTGPYM